MADNLDRLARRLETDPFFLASAFADYVASERLSEAGLAARLGCTRETLVRVKLCRRPRPEALMFQADIDRIASHFGVSADALAEMVRRADAIARMRQGAVTDRGRLVAARDRKPNEPKDKDEHASP